MTDTFDVLRKVVATVQGKPGWTFELREGEGHLRLVITDWQCVNAYDPGTPMPLSHWFPVPPCTYNERSWRRWVFECSRGVENHELGEWTRWGDERPFAPMHGPGENPYVVHETRPEVDARTRQDGSVRPVAPPSASS